MIGLRTAIGCAQPFLRPCACGCSRFAKRGLGEVHIEPRSASRQAPWFTVGISFLIASAMIASVNLLAFRASQNSPFGLSEQPVWAFETGLFA